MSVNAVSTNGLYVTLSTDNGHLWKMTDEYLDSVIISLKDIE